MSKMRVRLLRGKHPLYETLVKHPPEGVEYLPREAKSGAEEYVLYDPGHSALRSVVDGTYRVLRIPRCVPVLRRYDLVHSSRGFLVLGKNKYVVDVEHASSFAGMHHSRMRSIQLRRLIEKGLRSESCVGILPHCYAAKRTISLVTSEKSVSEKTTVVYPAVSIDVTPVSQNEGNSPTLLFMGEYFWKGGREFIKACIELSRSLDFRVIYVSLRVHPPVRVIEEARNKFDLDYLQGPIARRQLLEDIYPKINIFVMPTYIDTFGYAFLEAMSYGIPCIGTHHFAVPEIIEHRVTGLLVKPPISYFDSTGLGHPEISIESLDTSATVEELCDALDALISSRSARERMGSKGLQLVTTGRFSIRQRNEMLRRVYERSLRF